MASSLSAGGHRALRAAAFLALYACAAFAGPAERKPLSHYGLVLLTDEAIGARLAQRFKAEGMPWFLVHDVNLGVSVGDFMQFKDKVVLIESQVWKTLQVEGALDHLKMQPIVRVAAKASSASWDSRAREVSSPEKQKAYKLGTELLKILEEHFGSIPKDQELVLEFKGDNLVLLAPQPFFDQLLYQTVQKTQPEPMPQRQGAPRFVSPLRAGRVRQGDTLTWDVWAVDPGEPSPSLRYSMSGKLPAGVQWLPERNLLKGRAAEPGTFPILFTATNSHNLSAQLKVDLEVGADQPPAIVNQPSDKAVRGQEWKFQPQLEDPDDPEGGLRVTLLSSPRGAAFDRTSGAVSFAVPDSFPDHAFDVALKVTDPAGVSTTATFHVMVVSSDLSPIFLSELDNWRFNSGQSVSYRPVVLDPAGRSLRLRVIVPPDADIGWDGEKLRLGTDRLGTFSAEIVAVSEGGGEARQRIAYTVDPLAEIWTGISLRSSIINSVSACEALFERGGVHFGAYFTSLNPEDYADFTRQDLPYFFIGSSLLGAKQYQKGRYLFLDGGLILNRKPKDLTAGGILIRMDFQYPTEGFLKGVYDFSVLGHAKQALLITETATADSTQFESQHLETAKELLSAYKNKQNVVLTSRMEAWYPVGYGAWTGPSTWRLDLPLAERYEQRFGWGVRFDEQLYWLRMASSLRLGWGGDSAGFGVNWDLRLDVGRWN